jgi:hypothetical protein
MAYKRFINIINSLFIFLLFIFIYVNFVKADMAPIDITNVKSNIPGIRSKIFLDQSLRKNYCLLKFDEPFIKEEKTISVEKYGIYKKGKISITPLFINCDLDLAITSDFDPLRDVSFFNISLEKNSLKLEILRYAFIRKSDLKKLGFGDNGGIYSLLAFNDMANNKITPYTSPSEDILILKAEPFDCWTFWPSIEGWVKLKAGSPEYDFNNMNLKEIVIASLKKLTNRERTWYTIWNIITFADLKKKLVLIKFSSEEDGRVNIAIAKKKELYRPFKEFIELEYTAKPDIKSNYVTLTKIKEGYVEPTPSQPTPSQPLPLKLWLKIKCFFLRLIGKSC